jgi:hypothetical protein
MLVTRPRATASSSTARRVRSSCGRPIIARRPASTPRGECLRPEPASQGSSPASNQSWRAARRSSPTVQASFSRRCCCARIRALCRVISWVSWTRACSSRCSLRVSSPWLFLSISVSSRRCFSEVHQIRQGHIAGPADGPGDAQIQTRQRLVGVVQTVQALDVDIQILLPQTAMQLRNAQTPFAQNSLETGICRDHGNFLIAGNNTAVRARRPAMRAAPSVTAQSSAGRADSRARLEPVAARPTAGQRSSRQAPRNGHPISDTFFGMGGPIASVKARV